MKTLQLIAPALVAAFGVSVASAQVLMFDFGATTASGGSLTNSPYHTAAGGSFTGGTWNTVGTADGLTVDWLAGEGGNDTLHAAGGDNAAGGAGDDLFLLAGGIAPTRFDGGSGLDTLRLASTNNVTGAALANIERLEATDAAGGQLTTAQLGGFSVVAPVSGSDAAWLRLLLVTIGAGVTLHVVRLPAFRPVALLEPDPASPER